jgi:hypothetical protein
VDALPHAPEGDNVINTSDNRITDYPFWSINRRIEWETDERLAYYAANPHQIAGRLERLGREWDIERTLIANATGLALIGLLRGFFGKRWWLLLPLVVAGFLLQYGLQGWCPPLPLFRRLGIRTKEEIQRERMILRGLRGDLDSLCADRDRPPQERISQLTAVFTE